LKEKHAYTLCNMSFSFQTNPRASVLYWRIER